MATNFVQEGKRIYTANGSGSDVSSGGVLVVGNGIRIAIVDIDNGDSGNCYAQGVFTLAAKSADTWSDGDPIFWDPDNAHLTSDPTDATPAGIAVTAKTGGQTTRNVHLNVSLGKQVTQSANSIYVDGGRDDDYTANGSFEYPYKTLAAAVAAMTSTRNTLLILPATYTLTASLELPAYECRLVGIGALPDLVKIAAAVAVTPLIDISPASLSSTASYYLSNLLIANSETSQVGIQIDNASAGKKILLIGSKLEIEDGGTAIDVDHAGASDAVRIYINNAGIEIEGAINFDVGNASDKLYINNAVLGGLITFKGDNVASLIRLTNCIVPHDGCAVNDTKTTQEIVCLSCKAVTGTTYTALDTNDIGAGADFTETIID